MPIYEYQCKACGKELEVIQKISDPLLEECPECGQAELKKKVSAAAFRLKGGGWYETDFKTGSKKNLAGAAEAGGASASSDKASADKSASDKPKPAGGSESKSTA
tara:strand:- start:11608 stop:11922 length:315 start_codon:yes stop_codon:yes gene_type:complete